MQCKKCKKEIPNDSKFCVHCGTEVKDETKIKMNTPKSINDIKNHLEFLGYEITDETLDNGIMRFLAKNNNKSNLIITFFPSSNSYVFVATYAFPEIKTEVKKNELLKIINQINGKTLLSAFMIGNEFNTISAFAWYPDYYSKKQFSNFLDLFEAEIISAIRSDELKPFV